MYYARCNICDDLLHIPFDSVKAKNIAPVVADLTRGYQQPYVSIDIMANGEFRHNTCRHTSRVLLALRNHRTDTRLLMQPLMSEAGEWSPYIVILAPDDAGKYYPIEIILH